MKKITIVVLVALMLLTAVLPASAAVKATSVEIRGAVSFGNGTWDNSSFAGFFYDIKEDLGTETLKINQTDKTIPKDGMEYSTRGQQKTLNVVSKQYAGDYAKAIAAGLEQFGNGSMAGITGVDGAGNYTIVGWQAEKYIAIKKKSDKLAKLLVEHGSAASDKKTLTVGETWEVGGGYTLTANSIDAKASPRQVWLTLSKDGVKKDDKVVTAGTTDSKPVYTYVEKTLCGETDVPVFSTYVDSVFAGATTDMVQLRYTFLMSSTCTVIKSGDVFGLMKVTSTDPLTLRNSDNTVTLSQDTILNVMGDVKIKVADSTTLRYYPFVLKTEPGTYEVRGTVAFGNDSWDNSSFPGFFYDIKEDLGTETLKINETDRTIPKDGMEYSTRGQQKTLNVVSKQYSGDYAKAIAAGLEQFGNGSMAGITGVDGAGNYTIVGWQAEKYIAIKKKSDKLAKLLVEHGSAASDKKTLTVGETWEVGGGYTLTANSIDAKASPRQVWLTLSKDGVKKDDKVVTAGTTDSKPVYTYVEKTLCGETDVPVFSTYVDSVFAGATTDMVQLRYTFLISSTCTVIKSGDVFGLMKVTSTDPLTLRNSDNTVTLSQDTILSVMGEMKIKVADSTTLRYYPFVEYLIEGGDFTPTPTVGTAVPTTPVKTPNQTTAVTTTVAGGEGTTTAVATTVAPKPTQTEPGFEGIFAIAGLLAVAFLVLRQRK